MNLRNKLCPCGSLKKFKKCCGDPVAEAERQQSIYIPPPTPPAQTPATVPATMRRKGQLLMLAAMASTLASVPTRPRR